MWEEVQPASMAADGDVDTSRVAVKTYVPTYQKEKWQAHADELGMSQSEFVRTMVQAGHRGFLDAEQETDSGGGSDSSDDSPDATEEGLEDQVTDALAGNEHLDWDELLEAVTDDIESRLDEALAHLQDENRVRYSGRHGGYTLTDQ